MIVTIKSIHLLTVFLSFAGFLIRGIWMMKESPLLQAKLVKIVPHVIDTVFLVAGITLVVMKSYSLGQEPWLIAKIIGLVAYIVLGTIALKRGKTKKIRTIAWFAALSVFIYIYFVAKTHSALIGLG